MRCMATACWVPPGRDEYPAKARVAVGPPRVSPPTGESEAGGVYLAAGNPAERVGLRLPSRGVLRTPPVVTISSSHDSWTVTSAVPCGGTSTTKMVVSSWVRKATGTGTSAEAPSSATTWRGRSLSG